MTFSGISIYSPFFFVAYFSFLFGYLKYLSHYHPSFSDSLCAKGKHRRYAVFIGGGNNMQVLYERWKVLWRLPYMKSWVILI